MCDTPRRIPALLLTGSALAVGLMACSLPEPPAMPAVLGGRSTASGSIVYIGQDFNVYTMDGDGDNRQALTEDAVPPGADDSLLRTYHIPTWSPGGEVAFSQRTFEAGEGASTAVYISQADSQEPKRVFQEEDRDPIYLYWSPSGEQLAILASGGIEGLGLWLADREGVIGQIDHGQPYYWSWSPDGSSMLAHVGGATAANPTARLSHITLGSYQMEDWPVAPLIFQAPDHSPDGEQVLVAGAISGGRAGLMVFSTSGELEAVIAETTRPVAFSWSPAGQYVAYLRDQEGAETGFGQLEILELAEEGEVNARPIDLPPVASFVWSPEGDRLAVMVPEILPEGGDQNISISQQDGDLYFRLYIVDPATGKADHLTTFRPTAAFLTVVPFFDQYDRSSTFWSPDGSALVYTARREDGSSGVFRIEARREAEGRLLAQGRLAFWSQE